MSNEFDWLDIPAPRIESGAKLPGEKGKFKSMAVGMCRHQNPEYRRVWACDGRYVAFRRKAANPKALERHENFIAMGHYKHIETQDDVEVYELAPDSPFYRKDGVDVYELSTWECMRQAAKAAVVRDWELFTDIMEEIATRCRRAGHASFAEQVFQDHVKRIGLMIQMRGGPTPQECAAGKDNVMKKRGRRQLIIPARRI